MTKTSIAYLHLRFFDVETRFAVGADEGNSVWVVLVGGSALCRSLDVDPLPSRVGGVYKSLLRGCDGWRYRRLVCRYCPVPTPLGIAYSSHGHHPAQQGAYLTDLVDDVVNWFEEDIARSDSTTRQRLEEGTRKLGDALSEDALMQGWINDQILAMAGPLVERYRSEIGRYIAERIEAWNEKELVEQLESHVGKDLQFIRINGTLVGGLVGVIIHLGTEFALQM